MKVLVAVQDANCVDILEAHIKRYPWPEGVQFKILHIIHPVRVNSYMSLLPGPLTESIAQKRKEEGAVIVKSLADKLREGLPPGSVQEILIEGDAKSEIVDLLTEWNADLVLLGSHGKSGWMGSVSRNVVAHSPCSAVVVPIETRERKKTKEKLHIIV